MCGIFGYIGYRNCLDILVEGLKRLEYRGYDSAGISLKRGLDINTFKAAGKIADLEKVIESNAVDGLGGSRTDGMLGIGHTRWATHGAPTTRNAHPHLSCGHDIAVVHNGIIENYEALRVELMGEGHKFESETDSEVIPHLIEKYYKGNFESAVRNALQALEGAYAIIAINNESSEMIGARKGSPLMLGIGKEQTFLASDALAFIKYTDTVKYIEDGEMVVLTSRTIHTKKCLRTRITHKISNIAGSKVNREVVKLKMTLQEIEKGGYKHFMQKEIFEQPKSLRETIRGRIKDGTETASNSCGDSYYCHEVKLGGLHFEKPEFFENIDRVIIAACGTSYNSALVGEYYFNNIAKIPTCVEYASEFLHKNKLLSDKDLFIIISQSGETKDTLEALKLAKSKGLRSLGIVNAVGSTLARMTDRGVYLHAGPEIGVASTKAFTSQVAALYMISLALTDKDNSIGREQRDLKLRALQFAPKQVEILLKKSEQIKAIADKYADCSNFLYLGRGINYPVAMEGALKLKEISYIHAEGYPAAEMKHGPIALIDRNMPVVCIATGNGEAYKKVLNNMEEVKSREGRIICIANENDNNVAKYSNDIIYVPRNLEDIQPILNVIPLQLLAYYIADIRGLDIDKPRNLAKSVTVE